MKYLIPAKRIAQFQEDNFDLLVAVSVKRTSLEKNNWGTGWVFEATESFTLFCMLKFGWAPVELTDEEYRQILQDGISFLSKQRGAMIRKQFAEMMPSDQQR
jgi:hypothetical protein